MQRHEDKIVVITGAARGIGFAIAQLFAEEGAVVIVVDMREDIVQSAVKKLTDSGYRADGWVADITSLERTELVAKEIIDKYHRVDVLINNAGVTKDNLLLRMKEEEWDMVINVNLKGTFNCTQKFSKYMLKQRAGVILNISSVIGVMGNAGQANYAASKGGIIAFTKSCAKEFGSRSIRCNAIAPGFIVTEMTDHLPKEVVEKYGESIPLQHMGQPRQVAQACSFLASDEASYITGQVLHVDGGLIM